VADPAAPAELVLVFASTTEVLNAEDRLEAGDFNFALIPVPKEVNPNCGLALSFPEEIAPDIDLALAGVGLSPIAVYRRLGREFTILSGGNRGNRGNRIFHPAPESEATFRSEQGPD
jgi:hypothetical protein